ncbi:LuxR C-terminal-related transcriptional regulator [Actinomadura sp. HBU206391]|uniref:LuxR C-terminal-related transcriptional regulator n=1 Tax=Actinomadura sp. HBU206391 TaxID=2731692 RepID=UPI00164F084B|nr:LuxR C-terminal-related transcriptional regulator [Actinomadura sp. HBU206391]MBC6457330.1 LuxR family transcriptional regulator [Actinomadura sp. HBU206391]
MSGAASSDSTRRQRRELPAEVTSFVGRRHELAEVKRLLSASRMVTLTGMGGVGKTRLAMRAAGEVRRAFRHGVSLVELAELDDSEQLIQVISTVMGPPPETQTPETPPLETLSPEALTPEALTPLEQLAEELRGRQALLILDNCEHLLLDCAVVAETLLRSAPDLRILATSRQALGTASEHLLSVPPLLPPPGADGSRSPLRSSAQNEAVQLFTDRARAVLPDFAVTESNRDAVEGICRRLDGIPLAIELAAMRLRALSAQELFDRLDDRFRLVTRGSPAAPPRHRTLQALIDWSHDLCTEQERLLWARASVFSGGLDLEAAEAVCAGDGIAREEIIDLVTGLVDKSVLIREEHPAEARYHLLETTRQYGLNRLAEAGDEHALRARHRDHFLRLSAEARARLFGPAQAPSLTRLIREHANLRAALEYCFADPAELTTGLGMAADLTDHWVIGQHLAEGRRWLDRGLAVETGPTELRARALLAGGRLALLQADTAPPGGASARDGLLGEATAMLEESRALGERLGRPSILGYADLYTGMLAGLRGDAESAVKSYEEAAARHRAADDPAGLATTLIRLSLAHCLAGDPRRAVAMAEECIELCDAHGERWYRAYALLTLGIATWRDGDTRRATALAKQSLRFTRSIEDSLGVGAGIEVLAWIAAAEGRHQRAAQLLGILQTLWRATGATLAGFGRLMDFHDRCESTTRQGLGEPAFREAVRRGAALGPDTALGYALQDRSSAEEGREEAPAPSPLTRRETEIARLVAKGLSNKEIATTLTIAQRTAEGHIEHILGKLGFNSRTQIAVWVGEQQEVGAKRTDA